VLGEHPHDVLRNASVILARELFECISQIGWQAEPYARVSRSGAILFRIGHPASPFPHVTRFSSRRSIGPADDVQQNRFRPNCPADVEGRTSRRPFAARRDRGMISAGPFSPSMPIPQNMRLVPATGAVILLYLPGIPEGLRNLQTPEGGTQGGRIDDANSCLRRLSSCWSPGQLELADAPVLQADFVVPEDEHFSLRGRIIRGHPYIGDGRPCVTSIVIAYDGRRGRWVRTVSRWYRVATPGAP
jgi:hypothetical protein